MKTLAILGAGHLGLQIAHYAISDNHYDKVVFFDDFATVNKIQGISIIGNAEAIINAYSNKSFDELIIGIGYKHLSLRKKHFDRFSAIIPFGKIIHSTSWIDLTATVNEGCVVYPSCSIDSNVEIGANSILNIACTVAHDTKVGKHSFLSPRVALAGFINIGEMCILGINSTIIDNISITSTVKLGGGTVVTKNIENSGLYVGNPQRFIR
jgi:sugar O-acyltransferase (sialic acid O-acetyltransferase NeuD family)